MPLELNEPTFDRTFDEIYRELRNRIPRYNPAWTNFNDSDPGITLLQLFAWLSEMTLHRMNDVPRLHYLKFAELLGLQLTPPRPALVRLTFSAKPSEPPATIAAGSRVSAPGASGTLVFETTQPLDVIGAELGNVVVFADGAPAAIDLAGPGPAGPFFPLGRLPQPGNALYLGFKPNPNNPKPFPQKMRFLALLPQAATNGEPQRVGLAASDLVPPVDLVWEYRPKADQDVWLRLNVLADESVALTRDGYIDVEGPQAIEPSIDPSLKALVAEMRYWVRVRLDQNMYPAGRPPQLEFFVPNSVDAVNLQTEKRLEPIGQSNGNANQTFDVPKRPVQPGSLKLEVRPVDGDPETDWIEVPDLVESKRDDRHYQLDAGLGRITFGDGNHGVIPTSGAAIVPTTWRYGGGTAANSVEAGAIKTIVDQTQGIEKVTNVRRPAGGADEEPLQDFKRRVPGELRRNGRAISENDFETIARSIGGVRGVKALGGRHPDFPDVTVPGAVTVLVVADSDQVPPRPSAELLRSIGKAFEDVRLITTEVYVAAPTFIEIRVEARVFAEPEAAFDQVAQDARRTLNDYLSPFKRRFGENVSPAALYSQLFNSSGSIRSVEDLLIYVDGRLNTAGRPVEIASDALVYPGDHLIVVRPDTDEDAS
jgi:predicted phage baseplate assembly protein